MVCMSMTPAWMPFDASCSAASSALSTMTPHAMIVASSPSLSTEALPISRDSDASSV